MERVALCYMYNNTQVEHSTYACSETCINCLPAPTSVEEPNTIQLNGGNVWNTARDQDIHCSDFFLFDFTSNVKRSKWVKWRLRVHIARWLIFLVTSCKGFLYLYVVQISFLLVYLTILMQLNVIWLPLRLNQQKWEDQSNDGYFFLISSRMVLCMQLNFLTDRDVISLM